MFDAWCLAVMFGSLGVVIDIESYAEMAFPPRSIHSLDLSTASMACICSPQGWRKQTPRCIASHRGPQMFAEIWWRSSME